MRGASTRCVKHPSSCAGPGPALALLPQCCFFSGCMAPAPGPLPTGLSEPRGRVRRLHPSPPAGPWSSLSKSNHLPPHQLGNRSNHPHFHNSRATEACWPRQNRENCSRRSLLTKPGQKLSQDTYRANLIPRDRGGRAGVGSRSSLEAAVRHV